MTPRPTTFAALILGSIAAMPAGARDIDLTRLPLGDDRISREPKVGWIWACRTDPDAGGAHRVGPWIDRRAGTWNAAAKVSVGGAVQWPHAFRISREGETRVIVSNGLPRHPTGAFPIKPTEQAYRYDRNPNRIGPQNIRIALHAMPQLAPQPACAPGAVGILLTGSVLFNALDLPGRDAVAHETQDRCQGHPQESGVYHYHSMTSCIDDRPGPDGHSRLVGYALDGFGIFGNYHRGERLLSADLDACHGHIHAIDWDGRRVEMFHYHATPDFPYTVGCMRGAVRREDVRALVGPPPRGRPGFDRPAGPGLGGPPDLAAAARRLGISEQRLRAALGPPPPDLAAAARNLGIPVSALRAALGIP
jgi:hypothetical protein